jgi:Inorganic pyrophosphatase
MMVRSRSLDRPPLVDPETGDYSVVLETSKGSRNKYKYDPDCGAIKLSAVLGEGLSFPYDFGFFPSTVGEDATHSMCFFSSTTLYRRARSPQHARSASLKSSRSNVANPG